MRFLKKIAIFFFDCLDKYIHQKKIISNLEKINTKIDIVFDVGSHKGTYTDLFLKNFDISMSFIFEPQKDIFKYIKKKYKNNRKVLISSSAVSNQNKTKKFFVNKHDLTSSFTTLNKKNKYLKYKSILFGGDIKSMIVNTYNVKTIKLIDFINKIKIKQIDLLKIDTEGHEYQVLLGLGKKIKNIKIILIEFHNDEIYSDYDRKKIHMFLTKNKFKLKKKIKFPFTEWEDRIYISTNII